MRRICCRLSTGYIVPIGVTDIIKYDGIPRGFEVIIRSFAAKMVKLRPSVCFLSLLSFAVYGVVAQDASTTTIDPSPTEVIVPSSQVAVLTDSPVIDDTSLIENLFAPVVNTTDNSTLVVARNNNGCKCYPGQWCWPTQIAWDLLNLTLSGQLIKYVPAAAPCHNTFEGKSTYNENQCAVINGPNGWVTEEFQYIPPFNDSHYRCFC